MERPGTPMPPFKWQLYLHIDLSLAAKSFSVYIHLKSFSPLYSSYCYGPAQILPLWLCFLVTFSRSQPRRLREAPLGHADDSVYSCTLHTSHAAPIRASCSGQSLELSFAIRTPGQLPDSAVQRTNQRTAPTGKRREGNERIAPVPRETSAKADPVRGKQAAARKRRLDQEDS